MLPIIEIQSVSKKFKISHESSSYLSLRDRIVDKLKFKPSQQQEDFWALKDINFDIMPGDSIGIIGKNGAGKSTLLKILSKITPPTQGKIISRGRIASLLEVGTGFHPELTGRENVYLNGSILGMRKKEIDSRFDEIIDFAGVEKFLDTPLKHYSSGMQLRLAFSVAAFLEPEILVIDEVLAVGDAQFQKKCLGKMEDVTRSGRTILFVSHNMAAVESLCSKGLLLDSGTVAFSGTTRQSIDEYQKVLESSTGKHGGTIIPEKNGVVKKIEVFCDGRLSPAAYMGCKLEIKVQFKSEEPLESPVLGLIFKDVQNTPLICINNRHYNGLVVGEPVKSGSISMLIPALPFFEGNYFVDLHFGNLYRDIEIHRECFQLTIDPMKFSEVGELPDKQLNKFFIKDIVWSSNQV